MARISPLVGVVLWGQVNATAAGPVNATVQFRAPPWPERTMEGVDELTVAAPVSWLEGQIALARIGFSGGSIDGVPGPQSRAALRAFQENEGLEPNGALDEATRIRLVLTRPALSEYVLSDEDLADLQPVGPTWLEKSHQTTLAHTTMLERLAERVHAHPNLLRKLNPGLDWTLSGPGARVIVPAIGQVEPATPIAHLHIRLADRVLQARDASGRLVVHFPVSIAREVAKRPVGELRITVVIPNPDYTFNPEVFPESEEARRIGRKLMISPGPNNPVGLAWIGLDRPGYGIHGTAQPEQVGRTESHGCFRLANWDAATLLRLVWVGLPVMIEP